MWPNAVEGVPLGAHRTEHTRTVALEFSQISEEIIASRPLPAFVADKSKAISLMRPLCNSKDFKPESLAGPLNATKAAPEMRN